MCISLLLLLILVPLYPLIAFFLFVFSGPPLLFKQIRTGKLNQPFQILKFRSMKTNQIKSIKTAYTWADGIPEDFVFKTPLDAKVTKIGAILRKTSIDELPQLINVLRGEMSLIGPRPDVPEITNYYTKIQRNRLLVKPGLTGWAQVNGRADSCHGNKIEHDLYYVENCSFHLDIKILILTIGAIFKGKGAY